jgi:hypothetical protein
MKNKKQYSFFEALYHHKDGLWLMVWFFGMLLLFIWDTLYLNRPALLKVIEGAMNTFLIAFLVIVFALFLAWIAVNLLFIIRRKGLFVLETVLTFLIDIIRSIPQIIGILLGFVFIAGLLYRNIIQAPAAISLTAVLIAIFVFQELMDLMLDRVNHFRRLDFYQAMTVCGISGSRILNYHILWKNSRRHILNKVVAIFGVAVFLQCSVDFIISVGLSTDISSIDLPVTLGGLLAHIDSKQDILAIGHAITNPGYFPNLFFKHLQGISVAFLIVFSLFCIYKISNGLSERFRL